MYVHLWRYIDTDAYIYIYEIQTKVLLNHTYHYNLQITLFYCMLSNFRFFIHGLNVLNWFQDPIMKHVLKFENCVLVAQSCPTLLQLHDHIACQAPLSMEFSRQEYWSGLPFPSPEVWNLLTSNKHGEALKYYESWGKCKVKAYWDTPACIRTVRIKNNDDDDNKNNKLWCQGFCEDKEQFWLSCIAGGNVNRCSYFGKPFLNIF